MRKKAIEAPSNIIVLIIFVVIIALLIVLLLFFGKTIKGSTAFQKLTNFTQILRWG